MAEVSCNRFAASLQLVAAYVPCVLLRTPVQPRAKCRRRMLTSWQPSSKSIVCDYLVLCRKFPRGGSRACDIPRLVLCSSYDFDGSAEFQGLLRNVELPVGAAAGPALTKVKAKFYKRAVVRSCCRVRQAAVLQLSATALLAVLPLSPTATPTCRPL